MNTGLHGKVAIVAGVDKGIGKAIAMAFANEGIRLMICAKDEVSLKTTENEIIERFHSEVTSLKANLMKLNDIKRVISKTISKYKRVDILINNAVSLHFGGIFQFTDDDFEQHFSHQVISYLRFAREVIPYMQKQGGGRIINIIGTPGNESQSSIILTRIANAALLGLTKALSIELADDKITVNSVTSEITETLFNSRPIFDTTMDKQERLDEPKSEIINSSSKKNLIKPEEIASAVVFLCSENAGSISGISINVDGGKINYNN